MSDFNPFMGVPGPIEEGPEPDEPAGVADGDGQPTEQPAPEEIPRSYLDAEELGESYVRVPVDGVQMEVPLREALQGYSRTSDYTRKTQALAEQRKEAEYALAVQRALQAQPEETLRLLGRQYGVDLDPQQHPAAPNPYTYQEDENPYVDPVTKRLNEQQRAIDSMMEQQQEQRANETLRAAVGGLQQKYQLDDSTVREVVSTALQAGLGPAAFEMVYKNLAFDRAAQARQLALQQHAEQDAQRQQAKAVGAQLVGTGGSAASAGAPLPGPSDGRMSIREAFEAAMREQTGR